MLGLASWFHCRFLQVSIRVSRRRKTVRLLAAWYGVQKKRGGGKERHIVPNLEHSAAVGTRPDAENVLAISDAEDSSTDLVARLTKLVADDRQQQVLPVAVRHALLETHDPLATLLVLIVLPYRTNAFLEEMVVGNQGQGRRPPEVAIYGEELLGGIAGGDRVQGLLVLDISVGLRDRGPEPEYPAVSKLVDRRRRGTRRR